MEKVKKIKIPTYEYTFHIVKTDNINKSRSKRDNIIGNKWDWSPTIGGLHSYNESYPEAFIFLNPKETPGIIAHECYHGISRMFEYIGADSVDEEIMAYTLGDIIDQVSKFINTK